MNRMYRVLSLLLLCMSSVSFAQNLGTGLYAFGSFDSRGFDTINLGNLNTHFEIPIVNKQGRGLNFNYSLVYDGLVWSPSVVNGVGNWTPDGSWGFRGQLAGAYTGYITFKGIAISCGGGDTEPSSGPPKPPVKDGNVFSTYIYHDPYGRQHQFNYTRSTCSGSSPSGDGSSSDGDGYTFDGSHVHSRSGQIIIAPFNPAQVGTNTGMITDTNGNSISNNGNGTFTDTLGVTALTIGGSATQASPLTFTYPVTLQADGATSATATIAYKTYTVQTNFQCSGITEYGSTSVNLVDHINLADGSSYSFTYEATPGIGGAVTGRLASITLPTGGSVNYSYTGGCSGSGISADGAPGDLTRETTDGSRSYTRSPINANATSTTVQDEEGNQALYQFTLVGGSFYETHRQLYQGSISGTPLLEQLTCYNGTASPCDGSSLTLPITGTVTLSSYNGGSQLGVLNSYDVSGMLTSSRQMNGNSLLKSVTNTYNSLGEITASTTADSTGTATYAWYGYDENSPTATSGIPQHGAVTGIRGNQTSAHVSTGSIYLNTTTTYYDTGAPIATTTPNGTTQYGYDSTQTFATTTTLPTPSSGVALATSASYDQQSGAPISATGMNPGQTAQVTQYDGLLRPTSVSLPNGGQVNYNYVNPNESEVSSPMGNGQTAITFTLNDAYGRLSRTAVNNGQAANGWYQVDYCYDATGLLQFQSTKYQSTGFIAPKQCSGSGTSYVYDALGRVTSSTNNDGPTSYQYQGRAVKKTDVNGVQRITQYDLLGRISEICEISSNSSMPGAGSPVSCGADIAGTGFLTNYSYNLSNLTTTITQGAQQRVVRTDAVGRTTSVTEPERGTTTYSYVYLNGVGLTVTRTRPRANQTDPSKKTTTTTQYDSIGRVIGVSYSDSDDGLPDPFTPNKQFDYDAVNSQMQWTQTPTNTKGMLVDMASGSATGSNLTRGLFSYDVMGHVTTMWQCTPSICGTSAQTSRPPLTFSFDLTGNLIGEFDSVSGNIVYGRSPAGEVTSITNQTYANQYNPANLVSNVVNGPFGPTSYDMGNGLSALRGYDSLGRFYTGYLCATANKANCYNTQMYGFNAVKKGVRVQSSCDTVIGPCLNYGYDEFNRLTSLTGQQSFNYTFDRYGNRWSQNVTQGSGPAPNVSFDVTTNKINSSGYAYDAAGNLTNDSFHSYTYDAEGNVLQVDSGTTAQYGYDALNRRVLVKIAGSGGYTNEFQFDYAGQLTSTWQGANNVGNEGRVYWDGQLIAYHGYDGTTYFDHQDWLGTERMRTNYAGANAATFTSLPFGDAYSKNISFTWADQDGLHFAQQQHDGESNTDHAQFRQYSSTQGRWMSPDPYDGSYDATNPQSLNRYSYVGNMPLNYIDPNGLYMRPPTRLSMEDIFFFLQGLGGGGGYSGSGGSGGGGRGAPSNVQKKTQQCVTNFYNSKLGKAVQFGSPLSLLPVWNPGWGNNLQEWGVAIVGKIGGLFGSGATPGTNQLTTLSGTKTVGSAPELATEGTLGAIEKVATPAMALATVADIIAHGTCAMMADPAAANAALQSVP